jgi:hypothetical protein
MVLAPATEQATTRMSLTALTDRVHSGRAIQPRWNYFSLMDKGSLLSESDSEDESGLQGTGFSIIMIIYN